MRYSLMMQELKSVSDITNYKAGLVFGEVHPFLYVRLEWSAVHFLENQIKPIQKMVMISSVARGQIK